MCCGTDCLCELEKTNPIEYKLRVAYIDHGQNEEFYAKQKNYFMFDYHKAARLKAQKDLFALRAKKAS